MTDDILKKLDEQLELSTATYNRLDCVCYLKALRVSVLTLDKAIECFRYSGNADLKNGLKEIANILGVEEAK